MNARVLLLSLALLLAGCGSDDSEGTATAANGPEIDLVDFKLEPADVHVDNAGSTTFKVVNNGQTTHALEIEGNGVEEETTDLAPGESAELTVDLAEGEYEIYCPVDGHRAQGMEGTLTVGSAAAGSSSGDTNGDEDMDTDTGGGYGYP